MASLSFPFMTPMVWVHVPIEDPRAREVYDRHYSRQTPGADGIVAPGRRFLLMHEGPDGLAIWAVVYNQFRAPGWEHGRWFFRNSIFRNESGTLSSSLIESATKTTYDLWLRRYGPLPEQDLITEIDVEATRRRRSKRKSPGACYMHAGWELVSIVNPGHGRPTRATLRAPRWGRPDNRKDAACSEEST